MNVEVEECGGASLSKGCHHLPGLWASHPTLQEHPSSPFSWPLPGAPSPLLSLSEAPVVPSHCFCLASSLPLLMWESSPCGHKG